MKEFMLKIQHIYSRLQDEQSQKIFEARVVYALTGDYTHIQRIIEAMPQKKNLDNAIDKCRQNLEHLVVYGVGNDLLLLEKLYPNIEFKCFCDRNEKKQQEGWKGYPVLSPEQLLERKQDVYIAINSSGFQQEIEQFLMNNGVEAERIINLGAISAELLQLQYFDTNIMVPEAEEVFVDGGCYDCGTVKNFINWCQGNYKKVYAFEPDSENYRKCLLFSATKEQGSIEVFNRGLWNFETQISFDGMSGQGSRIGDGNGADTILTATIDDVVGEDRVTFIKLDVEGAELRALKGAEKSIRQYHPKLAICIYHKPEDVMEILDYILSIHDDYRLYIRHYQLSDCETVVYAV